MELFLPTMGINQKQYYTPGKMTKIYLIIKGLEDVGVENLVTSTVQSPVWLLKKINGSQEMKIDDPMFNQVGI